MFKSRKKLSNKIDKMNLYKRHYGDIVMTPSPSAIKLSILALFQQRAAKIESNTSYPVSQGYPVLSYFPQLISCM